MYRQSSRRSQLAGNSRHRKIAKQAAIRRSYNFFTMAQGQQRPQPLRLRNSAQDVLRRKLITLVLESTLFPMSHVE